MYRPMVIYEEICLTLTLLCPPQNTWSDSVTPQMLQHRLPTPNGSMVLWIAEHEGQGLAAAVFLGNSSIRPGHWMPLACGGGIHTGMTRAAQDVAVHMSRGYFGTLEQQTVEGKLWAKPTRGSRAMVGSDGFKGACLCPDRDTDTAANVTGGSLEKQPSFHWGHLRPFQKMSVTERGWLEGTALNRWLPKMSSWPGLPHPSVWKYCLMTPCLMVVGFCLFICFSFCSKRHLFAALFTPSPILAVSASQTPRQPWAWRRVWTFLSFPAPWWAFLLTVLPSLGLMVMNHVVLILWDPRLPYRKAHLFPSTCNWNEQHYLCLIAFDWILSQIPRSSTAFWTAVHFHNSEREKDLTMHWVKQRCFWLAWKIPLDNLSYLKHLGICGQSQTTQGHSWSYRL